MHPRSPGARRLLRALPIAAALAVALPAAAQAAGNAYIQVNDLTGRHSGGQVAVGAHATLVDTPGITCGATTDTSPADSVAALLNQLGSAATTSTSGTLPTDPDVLTIDGSIGYPMQSLGQRVDSDDDGTLDQDGAVPSWHLWIDNTYINLGYHMQDECDAVHDGQTVVLQASKLAYPVGQMYALPTTPHLRVEALPRSVAAGQTFTATVASYLPAWGSATDPTPARTAGTGYGAGLYQEDTGDYGTFTATDAQGHVTLTAPSTGGFVSVAAVAGTDPAALPVGGTNSAASAPVPICVYDGSAGSPCTASLSSPGADFGSQARGSIGAATAVAITPAMGRATIAGAKIVSGDVDDFMVTSDGCTATTVDSGATTPSCAVRVRFAPSVTGARTATLRITSNATNSVLDVPLTGTGGAPGTGTPGPAGADGAKGDAGATGATGATGGTGANGAAGLAGAAGAAGPQGKAGKNGRDAVCTVKRAKGAPKVTCKVVSSSTIKTSSKASLTRLGKVYAKGTVASLRVTRKVPAGAYTLRYRSRAGRPAALRVRIG